MKYGINSFSLISALLPTDMTCEKPEFPSFAISNTAVQNAPDCDMNATFPSGAFSLANVRLIFALLLIKPRQFGPINLIFAFFSLFVILSSSSLPSAPVSPNPAEMIRTVFTFFSIHWSTDSSTI